MKTKTCTKCGEVKALDAFWKNKNRKDGIDGRCKQCNRDAANKYRAENIELVREKDRARVAAMTSQSKREKHKKWRDANREKVRADGKETMRRLYEKDPLRFRNKAKEWRSANYGKAISTTRNGREKLIDGYVAYVLRLPLVDCSPELIALKREQLQIYRITKQLNQAIKESQK